MKCCRSPLTVPEDLQSLGLSEIIAVMSKTIDKGDYLPILILPSGRSLNSVFTTVMCGEPGGLMQYDMVCLLFICVNVNHRSV